MQQTVRNSIRTRLRLWLIILSIGPLLFFGGLLVWQNLMIQLQEAKELQRELTQLVSHTVSSSIHEQESILLTTARINGLIDQDFNRQQQILSKLLFSASDKRHKDILNSIDLLDKKGHELTRLSRELVFTAADNRDRSQTEDFLIPAGNQEIYYSPVYFHAQTGQPLMKIAIPLVDLRALELQGVLVAVINMEFMVHLLREIHIGESGVAYVLDKQGRLLAHPNPSLVLRGTTVPVPQQASISFGLQEKKSLVDVNTIMFGRHPINIVTELPLSEALQYTVHSLAAVLVFLLLALGGAVALGIILTRQIIWPVESLSRVARAIRQGDFTQQAEVSTHDEIGVLADSFNEMTAKLVQTIHSLERQMAEIQEAETQIIKQNELMNNIMNSLSHPFYVIDAEDYTIQMANSASGFGTLAEHPTCYSLTHHADKPCGGSEHPCTIEEIKKTLQPVNLEHVHYDNHGKALFFEVHGYPIFDKDGKVIQVIEYSLDITAKKKLERELLQSQKMEAIGQLSGGIAHDFNNLLTVINGYSEFVLRILPSDHPVKEKIEYILEAGEKAAILTRQLLAFSRKQVLEARVINLNTVVENMTKLMKRIIGEDILLELNTSPTLNNVKADPGQMEQVVMNLVVNARAAMPGGGRLTIETANVELDEEYAKTHEGVRSGAYVMFAVTDNGCGMPQEIQQKIFEPFFTTKGRKGTGLGLSTVYGIIKQHGGSIYVYSEPNIGTTFKIYLPITGEAAEIKPIQEEWPLLHGGQTILVVDDEPSIRRLIADTLQPLGYDILEAKNGRAALQLSAGTQRKINLLLTDVVMPEMGGKELAEAIKQSRPAIKILFMSGYTSSGIVQQGILESNINFLQKPITPGKLIKKIHSVLNGVH